MLGTWARCGERPFQGNWGSSGGGTSEIMTDGSTFPRGHRAAPRTPPPVPSLLDSAFLAD